MDVSGRTSPNECSSTLCKGSEEDVQIACKPCDRKGSRRAAQGYCENCQEDFCTSCFDSHIIYKPCLHHTLLDQRPRLKSKVSSDALPVCQGKILVKKSKDKKTCKITGMTLLTPDTLVLTDENNECVKMADIHNESIVSQLPLSASPYDVTTVTSSEVAVTLPKKQNISFLSVSSGKLQTKSSLKVDGSCTGIHCYNQKLIVTYSEPVKLEILNMEGQVLKTVTLDTFHEPYYVTANERSIYVSNSKLKNSSVIMLNWEGKETGKFGGGFWSSGLALMKNGKVFVCDRRSECDRRYGTIHEISADCTKGKVVLEDFVNPQSVCWCDESCTLYISSNPQTQDRYYDGNYLKAYKLPQSILEEF